ncbi:MEKHLA domain-containing protein [Lamprobacter modestohalophilus]|uniref:MEKHLA domain-containing protein n=1 Tax=Lamprobacter modestohalophilus TaxID=1064514 RepID=A0A9X0WC91_9GAMM|nr:MEKHLA domain-containing protein [Lamprobacter modestohalophilus]MBK1620741.1 MEKHLA domain-containing protein [Lamprobacter modestohalophilus]MEA1051255.1 MEKHLA domain-containing protein [Lamprobacter modestohalophilus]
MPSEPSPDNAFLAEHVALLCTCYRRLSGADLLVAKADQSLAEALYQAPFVVLSHGTERDPIFNYANLTAQRLFEMTWAQITSLPSRFSAEPLSRDERARLLAAVSERGFIDDYRGVRVSSSGRRFMIEQATVWTLNDAQGCPAGQAATFAKWAML